MPPHVHIDFVVPPPGCGRSVTDFWVWGAHRARLRCPDDVMCEHGVPGGALNLSSTSYPDHGRRGDLPLQGKIPKAELEIEHGTSWLVASSSDHQGTRLVTRLKSNFCAFYPMLQKDARTVTRTRPRLFPSTLIPIHYSHLLYSSCILTWEAPW
jgi:hypothetical protein